MSTPGLDSLTSAIDQAVQLQGTDEITTAVQAALEKHVPCDEFELPDSFKKPCSDTYARRLLYRSPNHQYVIVAMAWGPGHGTKIHDHGGNWCVEVVSEGQIEVVQFDLDRQTDESYFFSEQQRITSGCGAAGRLIPPFDYHTICNTTDSNAITLHVYCQQIKECRLFDPQPDGSYKARVKQLSFDAPAA